MKDATEKARREELKQDLCLLAEKWRAEQPGIASVIYAALAALQTGASVGLALYVSDWIKSLTMRGTVLDARADAQRSILTAKETKQQ